MAQVSSFDEYLFCPLLSCLFLEMLMSFWSLIDGGMHMQKVVLKIMTMNDEKTKQKAIEAVADIFGVDSIEADTREQKLTVIGEMDTFAVAKKLTKKLGKVDILTVGPAKEEKKDGKLKKEDKK
ncbi:unnamed protein product [Linum tenue]|uniref:HMA domain-containing protein n=1 Tax=Linum tenue TaxID=586396 RepID=A0AAV0JZD1_9ROSI|nr:unnamed protein product [Linum tenue]